MTSDIKGRKGRIMKSPGWKSGHAYRCRVLLSPVGERFSAQALHLPEITAEGGTEEEALANIAAALKTAITEYLKRHQQIPWSHPPREEPSEAKEKIVIVHV